MEHTPLRDNDKIMKMEKQRCFLCENSFSSHSDP